MSTGSERKPIASSPEPAAPSVPVDRASLSVSELAQAVLSRTVRPRVLEVRRLAEAVLAAESTPKRKKKKGGGKKAESKKKRRKLSKIPGQAANP